MTLQPRSTLSRALRRITALILILWFTTPAMAASVRQFSLEDMTSTCEFIFEGRVVGQQVKAGQSERDIRTVVSFEVLDVVKGDYTGKTIELSFMGGSLGDRALQVSDMHLPKTGERGIYFVESLHREQINPLCAWDQGHYLVERDLASGRDIVKTSAQRAVYGIDPGLAKSEAKGLSTGAAVGMRLLQNQPDEQPLSAEEFKDQLRALVGVR